MAIGLLIGSDEFVAQWLFVTNKQPSYSYDQALGLITPDGCLQGAVLFHNWNGSNVELSYYGYKTMTAGIVRCLAQYIANTFDPSRLTVTTSKRNRQFIKALQRLGFKLEGAQRCYYGKRDCNRNVGVRFVMFREGINKIAGLVTETPNLKKAT